MQRATIARNIRCFSTTRIMASEPSQIKGHVKWVAGTGAKVLGSMFSDNLKESGSQAQADGVREMRAAKEIGDKIVAQNMADQGATSLSMEGKSEGTLGRIVGCEGMKERGDAKLKAAATKMD